MQTFGNTQVDIVQLKVCGKNSTNDVYIEAICVPVICSPLHNQRFSTSGNHYPHLTNLDLADCYDTSDELEINILVGLDFYYSFMGSKVKIGKIGPVAHKSVFGWVLCGRYSNEHMSIQKSSVNLNMALCLKTLGKMYSQNSLNVLALGGTKVNLFHMDEFQRDEEKKQQIEHTRNDNLNNLLEKFYDTETLGSNDNPDIIKEFEKDLEFNGDRYICKLPLKQYRETIPDNYGNTFKRLKYLLNKLKKDTQLYTAYDAIIKEYISGGIVETVNSSGEEGMVRLSAPSCCHKRGQRHHKSLHCV